MWFFAVQELPMNRYLQFIAATFVIAYSTAALAQHYKVLYNFKGPKASDGAYPIATLIRDSAGNLYGTTVAGGTHDCGPYGGCGTVFELSPNSDGTWNESVLYSFCENRVGSQCYDGQMPESALILDAAGNLFGTTIYGGTTSCPTNKTGCGIVFELSPPSAPGGAWMQTVLYSFCEQLANGICLDGSFPSQGSLTTDGLGNLYGTTLSGGMGATSLIAGGVVFELTPSADNWMESILYNFCVGGSDQICSDGNMPASGVTFDAAGNLYGTTVWGGFPRIQGEGTVYELSPNSGTWGEKVLYALRGSYRTPGGDVSFDSAGNLYAPIGEGGPLGNFGAILKLSAQGGGSASFYSFAGINGGGPASGVLLDPNTNSIYGTTVFGGTTNLGVLYRIGSSGKISALHSFCQRANCVDGELPVGGLTPDGLGNVFGTTQRGGKTTNGASYGTVYEVSP